MRAFKKAAGILMVAAGTALLSACESEPRGALTNWNYYPGYDQSDRSIPDYDTYGSAHNTDAVKTSEASPDQGQPQGKATDSETMKESDALQEDPTRNAGFYDSTQPR